MIFTNTRPNVLRTGFSHLPRSFVCDFPEIALSWPCRRDFDAGRTAMWSWKCCYLRANGKVSAWRITWFA